MPAGRRHGLVEQARAHGAVGVVEAQARGDEARGRGGDGDRRRLPPVNLLCQQRLLGPLEALDGLRGARVQLQRVQEGRARVPKPLQQVQGVPGAR